MMKNMIKGTTSALVGVAIAATLSFAQSGGEACVDDPNPCGTNPTYSHCTTTNGPNGPMCCENWYQTCQDGTKWWRRDAAGFGSCPGAGKRCPRQSGGGN